MSDNYVSWKYWLLKDFDISIACAKKILISRFGKEQGKALIRESRHEYDILIPQIPYIGDKNPFLVFLIPSSRIFTIY
jgi:hypothetical protein